MISKIFGNAAGQRLLAKIESFVRTQMGIGAGAPLERSGEFVLCDVLKKSYQQQRRHLCVFDVGANTGGFAEMILKRSDKMPILIYSFEPGRRAFHALDATSRESGSVFAFNIALAQRQERALLYYSESGSSLASLTKRRLEHYDDEARLSEEVAVDTVDHFCRRSGVYSIDLLKIDVEGHELDVLKGANEMLSEGRIRFISFEFGVCHIDTRTFFQDFWYFFKQFKGVEIYRITPSGHLERIWKYREESEQFQTTNYFVKLQSGENMRLQGGVSHEFDLRMQHSSGYLQTNEPKTWVGIKRRFSEHLSYKRTRDQIPRRIHQIWLGGKLPSDYEPHINELKALHPNWEYKLWTDDNIDFDLLNRDLFDRSGNMGQKSDILRYEILNAFGGIYLDLDHAVIKAFDELLFLEAFAGVTYDSMPQVTNSLIGSRPGSMLAQELCNFSSGFVESPTIKEVFNTTGPDYFTRIFMALMENFPGMVAFPNAYFSPYPNFPRDRTKGADFRAYVTGETYCCHLWHCSWMKRKSATGEGAAC